MTTRLLVTGGAGFLGNHLLRRSSHFTMSGTLHVSPAASIPGVSFHVCDLQEQEPVRLLFRPDQS